MKRMLLLCVATMLASPVAFAEAESPRAICTAEAEDAGFESKSERDAYIEDCVAQITGEPADGGTPNGATPREDS